MYELFEDNIKDLDTERFSKECDDKFKEVFEKQEKWMKELGMITWDSCYWDTEKHIQ